MAQELSGGRDLATDQLQLTGKMDGKITRRRGGGRKKESDWIHNKRKVGCVWFGSFCFHQSEGVSLDLPTLTGCSKQRQLCRYQEIKAETSPGKKTNSLVNVAMKVGVKQSRLYLLIPTVVQIFVSLTSIGSLGKQITCSIWKLDHFLLMMICLPGTCRAFMEKFKEMRISIVCGASAQMRAFQRSVFFFICFLFRHQ